MSGRTAKAARRAAATAEPSKKARSVQAPKRREDPVRERRKRLALWSALAVGAAVVGLYAITAVGGSGGGSADGSDEYPYAVGEPGPGDDALPLVLPSTTGREFDLAAYRGKEQVLVYFQEGLTCQPCWDQMEVIEQQLAKFRALGIGEIVSVTTDPINLIEQKVKDEGIAMPVLADLGAQYSTAWSANRYQMMHMGERNGHSFVLVGKDGKIIWRGDYGGAPKYTMFLPVDVLLRDLRQGIGQAT